MNVQAFRLPDTMIRVARRHSSLLLMATGNGLFLLASVVLGKLLPPSQFASFGLLVTLISVQSTFGLMGLDHTLLRLADRQGGNVLIDRTLTLLLPLAVLLSAGLLTCYATYVGSGHPSPGIIFFVLAAVSAGVVSSQWFRLTGRYATAQAFTAGWRIVFGGAMLLLALGSRIEFEDVQFWLLLAMGGLTLASVLAARRESGRRELEDQRGERAALASSFFSSLLLVTALNAFDRILVINTADAMVFGSYFYNFTLAAAPFSLLTSYSGFRELGEFKVGLTRRRLLQSLRRNLLLGVAMAGAISAALLVGGSIRSPLDSTKLDIPLLVIFTATGLVKVCYAVVSAALGAVGDPCTIRRANAWTFVALLAGVASAYATSADPLDIAAILFILWVFRTAVCGVGIARLVRR